MLTLISNLSDLVSETETPDNQKKIFGIPVHILNGTATFDDVPLDGDFYWLLTCLFLCIIWFTYVIYYNSRIFGFVATWLLNHVVLPRYLYPDQGKGGVRPYLHVGSLSITFLSGKIMFRDLYWVTPDYSLRVQDGWFILRWWVPYVKADIRNSDFTQSDTRLHALFNGFEFHLYNRSETYARLLQVFGIHKKLDFDEQSFTENIRNKFCKSLTNDELIKAYLWRDFFPVTGIEISSGRFVFGNPLVPTTLLVTFDEANIVYSSKPAFSQHDLFTHIAKCKAQSFKIILANSPKYVAQLREDPPRFMGEGFVIFQSNQVELYYYQDEPGFASSKPEKFQLSTNDHKIERFTSPAWGLEVKSGKSTDIRYGPWADRQREALYNFFYPPDFRIVPVDELPREGTIRTFQKFDFRFSTLAPANIDILFTDPKKETNVLHLSAGPGSHFEVSVPLTSGEKGFSSDIVGTILHLDSSTTLPFRSLVRSETFEIKVRIDYPRMWNHHQTWTVELIGSKTTAYLLFEHKLFFQYLIDDWAGNEVPDLLKFIPYTCKVNLQMREFEIILLANEHNWIDCSGPLRNENCEIAVCGDTFELAFDLPFYEYLPQKIPFKIWIQGESLEAGFHVPQTSPYFTTISLMHKQAKLEYLPNYHYCSLNNIAKKVHLRTGDIYPGTLKWRNVVTLENDWFTCWSVPVIAVSITYHFHPVPPRRPAKQAAHDPVQFDVRSLAADQMGVELEIGPSNICLYGYLLRALWNIKENYMGECQSFTDLACNPDDLQKKFEFQRTDKVISPYDRSSPPSTSFDERLYRPFSVTVSVVMHELHGHLIKSCYDDDQKSVLNPNTACSFVYLDRLCFEMDKNYDETKLQLILSPVTLHTCSNVAQQSNTSALSPFDTNGYLLMSSLQFRGHAAFSDLNRPLGSETLEYSWLVEIEIGKICGQMTIDQLFQTLMTLEQLFVQTVQEDSALQSPVPYRKCLHDHFQMLCPDSDSNFGKICPYSEDVKYKMVRLSIKNVDLQLTEKQNLLVLSVYPIKFSTCNLHSCNQNDGLTLLINKCQLRHFIASDTVKSQINSKSMTLLEVMNVQFGPVFLDSAEVLTGVEHYSTSQKTFLAEHDLSSKRLWFLWPEIASKNLTLGKCGCVGGCAFFGSNLNGADFFTLNVEEDLAAKRFTQKKNIYSANTRDFLYGESLLNPGEPIIGFTLNSIYEEEDGDDQESTTPAVFHTIPRAATGNTSRDMLHSFRSMHKCRSIGSPGSCRSAVGMRNSESVGSSIVRPGDNGSIMFSSNTSVCQSALVESAQGRIAAKNSGFAYPTSTVARPKLNDQSRSLSETGIGRNALKKQAFASSRPPLSKCNSSQLQQSKEKLLTSGVLVADDKSEMEPSEPTVGSSSKTSNSGNDPFVSMRSIGMTGARSSSRSVSTLKQTDSQISLISTISAPMESNSNCAVAQPAPYSNEFEAEDDESNISSSSFCSAVSSVEELNASSNPSAEPHPESDEEQPIVLDDDQDVESVNPPDQATASPLHVNDEPSDEFEQQSVQQLLLAHIYSHYLSVYSCEPGCVAIYNGRELFLPKIQAISPADDRLSNIRLVPKDTRANLRGTYSTAVDDADEDGYFPGKVYEQTAESDGGRRESFHKSHRRQDSSEKVINLGQLEKQISKTVEFRSEKVTLLVQIGGQTSVRLSPLSLTGLSEFLECLVPALEQIHPLTVLNHIHLSCVNQVARKNVLKKQKALEYGQMKLKAFHSTLEREQRLRKVTSTCPANRSGGLFDSKPKAPQSTVITANQYEETRSARLQVYVRLAAIDCCFVQAGWLQSDTLDANFSRLHNVRQLNENTCISLFAARIDGTNLTICNDRKERRALHTFITNNAQTPPTSVFAALAQKDLVARIFSRKPKKEHKEIEPLTIETQQLLQQETIAKGKIGSLHMQLNRLKKSDYTLSSDAILTIIPAANSKVNFDYAIANTHEEEKMMFRASNRPIAIGVLPYGGDIKARQRRNLMRRAPWDRIYEHDRTLDDSISVGRINSDPKRCSDGFIMFEAGLEDITINAIKKQIVFDDKLQMNSKVVDNPIDLDHEPFVATTTVGPSTSGGFKSNENKPTDSHPLHRSDTKSAADKTNTAQPNVGANKNEFPLPDKNAIATYKNGASSFQAEVGSIWFNFAAPPKTPNTKKIDYRQSEWHLISTANPSIGAWIECGEYLSSYLRRCSAAYDRRVASALVYFMSNALEQTAIHSSPPAKYFTNKLTPFARALNEDPSCQLMHVLRRYLLGLSDKAFQGELIESLDKSHLPSVKVLRKGLVSLSRQWKNALYMPLLVEQNIRNYGGSNPSPDDNATGEPKAPHIPLRLLINESHAAPNDPTYELPDEKKNDDAVLMSDEPFLYSDHDFDESSNLLIPNESKDAGHFVEPHDLPDSSDPNTTANAHGKTSSKQHPLGHLQHLIGRSGRHALGLPMKLSAPLGTLGSGVNRAYGFLFSPNCVQPVDSSVNVKKKSKAYLEPSPRSTSMSVQSSDEADELIYRNEMNVDSIPDHNLYAWTRGQHEYTVEKRMQAAATVPPSFSYLDADLKHSTLCSAVSDDDQTRNETQVVKRSTADIDILPGFVFVPTGIHLGDVRIIFEPLFASMCIQNLLDESESNVAFEQLGPKISLALSVKLLKIELVESDNQSNFQSSIGAYKSALGASTGAKKSQIFKLRLPLPQSTKSSGTTNSTSSASSAAATSARNTAEAPAFDCARLTIALDLRKVKDFKLCDDSPEHFAAMPNVANTGVPNANRSKMTTTEEPTLPIVIMGQETNPDQITTVINFSVDINKITQKVNLPLLRLLHQMISVIESVKDTRKEVTSNSLERCSKEKHEKDGVRQAQSGEIQTPKCWQNLYKMLDMYDSTLNKSTGVSTTDPVSMLTADGVPSSTDLNEVRIQMDDENLSTTIGDKRGWTTNMVLPSHVELTGDADDEDIFEIEIDQSGCEPMSFFNRTTNDPTLHANESQPNSTMLKKTMLNVLSADQIRQYTNVLIQKEHTPLVVYGVAKIRRVNLEAKLSGLKLDGELSSFHISFTHKEKTKGFAETARRWNESSLTAQLSSASISLLEEFDNESRQTIVQVSVGKSHSLLSTQNKKGKDLNSALLSVGAISVHIPQHPVALHGVMTRSSRQLSTTLQEFKTSRISAKVFMKQSAFDKDNVSLNTVSENTRAGDDPTVKKSTATRHVRHATTGATTVNELPPLDCIDAAPKSQQLIKPIVVQFTLLIDSLKVGASLLPSLSAQYYMGQVISSGVTGAKARFTVEIREHLLSFNTRVPDNEVNLPSRASVSLPPIHVHAEYLEDAAASRTSDRKDVPQSSDGIVLRKGSYLKALAEIGSFEHCLTTDLLNHLLLVQKVFMKEIDEILQKMSGFQPDDLSHDAGGVPARKPMPTAATTLTARQQLLFDLVLRIKGVQITATTPTNSALRLETGQIELELSNRVQNMNRDIGRKLFAKLKVNLNVALGQLLKNPMFEEADPEFQQLAYFRTHIVMRNALQDELIASGSDTGNSNDQKEALLITLQRPLVYLQPIALDKAVLVWLNYKNAYEYWNEQRAALNTEVQSATQQVFDRLHSTSVALTGYTESPDSMKSKVGRTHGSGNCESNSTLFLQLTLDDLGICLPITIQSQPTALNSMFMNRVVNYDNSELKSAFVITLESSSISACSSGSWVSKAKFTGLCIRFADDFETSLDDWKPDPCDPTVMNLCVVSEGTYEICSKTTTPAIGVDAKWILNVAWRMEGFDIHVDVSIGKQLSSLFKTLTSLAGELEESESDDEDEFWSDEDRESDTFVMRSSGLSNPESVKVGIGLDHESFDASLPSTSAAGEPTPDLKESTRKSSLMADTKKSSRIIEQELNEQVRIINELKNSGASEELIEQQIRKFNELESYIFNDFKRDVMKKLRRQSVKSSPINKKARKRPLLSSRQNTFNESGLEPVQRTSAPDPGAQHQNDEEKKYCATKPFRPRSHEHSAADLNVSSASSSTVTRNAYNVHEPNIDFELDISVFFNSGKCVLHTKDTTTTAGPGRSDAAEEILGKKGTTKDLSNKTGAINLDTSSSQTSMVGRVKNTTLKVAGGNNMMTKNVYSSTRLRNFGTHASSGGITTLECTVFLIPGLDIKLHYSSKTVFPGPISSVPIDASLKRLAQKKASCFAWMTLHSIPEETLITPHLLDFLEQALEPIPLQMPNANVSPAASTSSTSTSPFSFAHHPADDGPAAMITSAPAQYAVYGSFPVDVIVYLHVQPSVLRFSCLPLSRVECLLQLPSVDLVFSSKRAEEELDFDGYSSPIPPTINHNLFSAKSKLGHRRIGSDYRHPQTGEPASVGGLSVTGFLTDFSLYIFHPYTNKKMAAQSSGTNANTASSTSSPKMSPKARIERKDSLSLQVEFVKLNISRTRKLVFTTSSASSSPVSTLDVPGRQIAIRFSGLCDIGSASFKYDIRRLTEILAFPKAWYRKVLWKRVFLGEQGVSDGLLRAQNRSNSGHSSDEDVAFRSNRPLDLSEVRLRREIRCAEADPVNRMRGNRRRNKESLPVEVNECLLNTPWETLILFGVNLSRLTVQMNMGNVMGQTSWLTRDLRSDGRVLIDSTGHKRVQVAVNLNGSTLDAKGGIVGGQIDLCRIEMRLHSNEHFGKEPQHVFSLKADGVETRIDYMGTSILMLRVSSLECNVKDEWKIDPNTKPLSAHPTKRPALLFIHCTLTWDQLQLLMSRSTTPDLIKISNKLEEFFSQQFHSGKRMLGSLSGVNRSSSTNRQSLHRNSTVTGSATAASSTHESTLKRHSSGAGERVRESRHHRHWQKALKAVAGQKLATLPNSLPGIGTILGGTFELNGNNISLACFAGVNFRTKSWAVFSLRHPHISFATEAQDILDDQCQPATHIVQNFSLGLGRKAQQVGYAMDLLYAQHSSMATVCRISRSVLFAPQYRTVHEWFDYAFGVSELDEVHRFPLVNEQIGTSFGTSSSPTPGMFSSVNLSAGPNTPPTNVSGAWLTATTSARDSSERPNDVGSNTMVSGMTNVVHGVAATLGASLQTDVGATPGQRRHGVGIKSSAAPANHKEIIFALPSLQMELKTEHVQSAVPPSNDSPLARVDCAFVTDFDDHIFVAVDVEAYFFLHDLISSYIKEKDTNTSSSSSKGSQSPLIADKSRQTGKTTTAGLESANKAGDKKASDEQLESDWRDFICQTWHLEPTVRLLSWAGKNIEPYGVDYILQRLGFTQARVTIPKWIQRGAMDPFDKVLAELLYQIVVGNSGGQPKALK